MKTFIDRVHGGLTAAGTWAGAIALGSATAMYIIEVALRYIFNAPTTWTSDWTSYLLAVVIFGLAPDLTRTHGHIAIELLPERLARAPRRMLQTGTMGLAAAVCAGTAYIALNQAVGQFRTGVETVAFATTQKWWITAVIGFGFANSSVWFARHAVAVARGTLDTTAAAGGEPAEARDG